MNDKHTPTPGPWKVIEVGQSSAGPDGVPVCEVYSMDARVRVCEFVGEADARRIVHCINTHDDMLKAMRRAVLALAFAAESSPAMRDDYEALSAAISRATSGEQT